MPELLFELGCEELPATFVRRAYEQLTREIAERLDEAGVHHGEPIAMGTPRRLIVSIPDVAPQQPDRETAQRGPALKAAFDAGGQPTPALTGFCRGQGIEPSQVRVDGDYVWADRVVSGRPTLELLADILPDAVRALTFDKSMRWGSGRLRFARPIRWMLAAFDGRLVDFEIESVRSGLLSRGHRFNHPEPFEAKSLSALLAGLREREVEPDAGVRESRIVEGAKRLSGGRADLSRALIEENVFLTEWPNALMGHFREDFLTLPEPVLVMAMAKHERMFPVRDEQGRITNAFVWIRNSGDEDVVREGNAWVLNARFNDAKFFFDEDSKVTMEEFLERTSRIVYQEKLGTVRQRAERLATLADSIARHTGASDEEREYAQQAALYCKADLSSGLVSELPALQGIIGGEYARREGFPEPVCLAIAAHYDLDPKADPSAVATKTAVRVLMADQLDKLAGYLGLGLSPSGSSDPYGLRRAATLLIEAAWAWPEPLPTYLDAFETALDRFERQGIALDHQAALRHVGSLFESRYEALFDGARHDHIAAAILPSVGQLLLPRMVRLRLRAVELAASDIEFVRTATRPLNIVAAAEKNGIDFVREQPLDQLDVASLQSLEGEALAAKLHEVRQGLSAAVRSEHAEALIAGLRQLEAPINLFFDKTMVMVDDEKVRSARLTLLEACRHEILLAGDFSKIVIEG